MLEVARLMEQVDRVEGSEAITDLEAQIGAIYDPREVGGVARGREVPVSLQQWLVLKVAHIHRTGPGCRIGTEPSHTQQQHFNLSIKHKSINPSSIAVRRRKRTHIYGASRVKPARLHMKHGHPGPHLLIGTRFSIFGIFCVL